MAKRKAAATVGAAAGGIDPLAPQVTPAAATLTNEELATFDFAVNIVKLNRAKAWVNQQAALKGEAAPKGKALVEAVKARYIQLGGLLVEQKNALVGRKGRNIVNLADEDDE